jgi:hypothetical protein
MQLHSIALRPQSSSFQPVAADQIRLNALLATLDACKRYLDILLDLPVSEYHLVSFTEWMRLPCVIMTLARLCMPNDSFAEAGWDVKMAHDRARLDLYLDSLCYRMQGLTTYDKINNTHPDFWFAMRMIMELTRTWFVRKINPKNTTSATAISALPTPDTLHSSSEGSTGAAPSAAPLTDEAFGMNMMLGSVDMSNHSSAGGHDQFAFLSEADFDMDKFFDMGIWGDEGYTGMGFGSGMQF